MTGRKAKGNTGAKQTSRGARKGGKTQSESVSGTARIAASAGATAASARAKAPMKSYAAERGLSSRPRSGPAAKDPLQASIERQSQLQLMIRTQNSAKAWARNVRQMQIFLLFAWFGLWSFLEPFLDIGHRVTHAWGLQSHRSAQHDVLVLNGALVEGIFSVAVAVGIGLLIYKGVQKAVRA